MGEQTKILATYKGHISTVAINTCVSVTLYIKVCTHWEVFMKRCVKLRLGME